MAITLNKLKLGENVVTWPKGNSMSGKINDGDCVTIIPITADDILKKGDVVFCKVNRYYYLHLIKGIRGKNDMFLIGNNRGKINGWTNREHIFGKVTEIEHYKEVS